MHIGIEKAPARTSAYAVLVLGVVDRAPRRVEDLVKPLPKIPVGAHYGLGDWLLQRLTAVVMAVYTLASSAAC